MYIREEQEPSDYHMHTGTRRGAGVDCTFSSLALYQIPCANDKFLAVTFPASKGRATKYHISELRQELANDLKPPQFEIQVTSEQVILRQYEANIPN